MIIEGNHEGTHTEGTKTKIHQMTLLFSFVKQIVQIWWFFSPIVDTCKTTRQNLCKILPNLLKISEQRLGKEHMFRYVQEWHARKQWNFFKVWFLFLSVVGFWFSWQHTSLSQHFHVLCCLKRCLWRILPAFIEQWQHCLFLLPQEQLRTVLLPWIETCIQWNNLCLNSPSTVPKKKRCSLAGVREMRRCKSWFKNRCQ